MSGTEIVKSSLGLENKIYNLDEMVPSQIVGELDKYIIGQEKAKRTIAVAIRNRTRRKKLPDQIKDEVYPKNIIMIGPTGVGKTEIARRIAKLSNAPFIKVEATKYTEVGYVGRDVESMVKDLMSSAVAMVKKELASKNENAVKSIVEERLLDIIMRYIDRNPDANPVLKTSVGLTREEVREKLRKGEYDSLEVEVPFNAKPKGFEIGMMGSNIEDLQNAMQNLGNIFQGVQKRGKTHFIQVRQARAMFMDEELEKSVDEENAIEIAKERTEQMGIIFIDEIDKIAGKQSASGGPDVSREGVQRDILPIVEGTKVSTRYGMIDTSHILFIAAGAFHVSKPSDLIPELQGRFPLRVELEDLKAEDFFKILQEPENAIIKQYCELLKTEGVILDFTQDSLKTISEIAYKVNSDTDNIGARRLYTIMEILLEELSFSANELSGQTVTITPDYVNSRLTDVIKNQDLSRYIL